MLPTRWHHHQSQCPLRKASTSVSCFWGVWGRGWESTRGGVCIALNTCCLNEVACVSCQRALSTQYRSYQPHMCPSLVESEVSQRKDLPRDAPNHARRTPPLTSPPYPHASPKCGATQRAQTAQSERAVTGPVGGVRRADGRLRHGRRCTPDHYSRCEIRTRPHRPQPRRPYRAVGGRV